MSNISVEAYERETGRKVFNEGQVQRLQRAGLYLGDFKLNSNPFPVMAVPPTITVGAAGAASTITNAVTIKEVTGTLPDLTPVASENSEYFHYYGSVPGVGTNFPNYNYVSPQHLINVQKINGHFGNWSVAFMFDGSVFEFEQKGVGTPSSNYRIYVDGQYSTATFHTGVPTNGAAYHTKVDFGSRAVRYIRLELLQGGGFGGLKVGPNDTVWKPSVPVGPKVVVIGDSFTEGTGSTTAFLGYVQYLAAYLGWVNVTNSGLGSTGYLAATGTIPGPGTPKMPFSGRIQGDVINQSPDIVIFAGGINDAAQQGLQNAVESVHKQVRQALPSSLIITLGPFWPRSTGYLTSERNAIKAGSASYSDLFIDTEGWFTGTGRVDATTGSGNADLYTSSDTTHPTVDGHKYIAYRIASELVAWAERVR
jgi:lysophospholipase L1-like esterase